MLKIKQIHIVVDVRVFLYDCTSTTFFIHLSAIKGLKAP